MIVTLVAVLVVTGARGSSGTLAATWVSTLEYGLHPKMFFARYLKL